MKQQQNMCIYLVKKLSLSLGAVLLSACVVRDVEMQLPTTLPEPPNKVAVNNEAPKVSIKKIPIKVQPFASLGYKPEPLSVENTRKLKLPLDKIAINVDKMPLNNFIHMALGEILDLSFEVDASLSTRKEPVTLHITKPVQAERLLGMVEQALSAYNIFLAWSPEGLRVLPSKKAAQIVPNLAQDPNKLVPKSGRTMTVIPLQYAKPSEALSFMRSFLNLSNSSNATINTRLNALVVTGMPERIAVYKEAISLIDRPSLENKRMLMLRPVYWQAQELAKTLKDLLVAQDIPVSDSANTVGVKIVEIAPTNALVVVAGEQKWLQLIQRWVDELDTVDAVGEEQKSYVYFVKNANAEGLGSVLSSVLTGTSSSTTTGVGNSTSANKSTSKKPTLNANKNNSSQGGSLRVIVDTERNALIFVGTARDYRRAYQLLQQLDRQPRQILIEATVADITIDDTQKLGVDWKLAQTGNNSSHTLQTLDGLGAAAGGLSYVFLNTASNITARINALATAGRAKILSSPKLLTKDNEQASMQVGTQVAVVGSEVSNVQAGGENNTNLLRSFTYVDTGVILSVTPTILEGGKVELALSQEVSEAGESSNNTPPIFTRKVETVLVAESGQTIMIAGLITHNESTKTTKVPILGDIPWLGSLFSNDSRTERSTNMVILITPHIVNSSAEATYLTNEFQKQLDWQAEEFGN